MGEIWSRSRDKWMPETALMVPSNLSHNVPALIGAAKNRLTDLATLDAKRRDLNRNSLADALAD